MRRTLHLIAIACFILAACSTATSIPATTTTTDTELGSRAGRIAAFSIFITQPTPEPLDTPPTSEPPEALDVEVEITAEPWGIVPGIIQFRGNPTHSWYGLGPVPYEPIVVWRYPDERMCSSSSVNSETTQWCGTGWTGQPVIWERADGVTEVIFGAYDRAVHFVDADTGLPTRPKFTTGDLIKGSVSLDPDGFPLLYFGSRDNHLRILSLASNTPTELWSLNSDEYPGIWNNDWDGNPSIVDGIMYEGGENGILFAIELNRAYDGEQVTVDPEILVTVEGWNQELLASVGDRNASIEGSVVVTGDRVYFANSAGRIVGVDISNVRSGQAPIVFDVWAGDDIDASLVVDLDGYIYAAIELERFLARSQEVGQIIKLDPADGSILWSVAVPPLPGGNGDGGVWATPALGLGVLYVPTHPGTLLAIDTNTGDVLWKDDIGYHAWSSPSVVDNMLVVATDCDAGGALTGYDLSYPRLPSEVWHTPLGSGCIESTPSVWKGAIYVGSRDGYFYKFASSDPSSASH